MNIKSFLQNFGLSLITLLILFSGLEIVFRIIDYDLNEHPRTRFHPTFGWTLDPDWGVLDEINTLGFRFREVDFEKPPGVKRLLILGDSFAQDTALRYKASFPGLLEESLSTDSETWQVINLGVGGWGTAQQWLALQELGLKFQPDLLLLQTFPYNDLCNNNLLQANTCATNDFHRPYFVLDGENLQPASSVGLWRQALRSKSRFLGWIENRLLFTVGSHGPLVRGGPHERAQRRFKWLYIQAEKAGLEWRGEHYSVLADEHQPEQIRTGWKVTERLIQEIAATAQEHDIPAMGMVIPFELTFESEFGGLVPHLSNPPPLSRDAGNLAFESFIVEAGLPLLSVRELILEDPLNPREFFSPNGFRGDRHLNRYGHLRITRALIERWQELGWIPTRSLPELQLKRTDVLSDEPMPLVRAGWLRQPLDDGIRHFGIGSQTVLSFQDPGGRDLKLEAEIKRLEPLETSRLQINGAEIAQHTFAPGPENTWRIALSFTTISGRNEISWQTDDAPGTLARMMVFEELRLAPVHPKEPLSSL